MSVNDARTTSVLLFSHTPQRGASSVFSSPPSSLLLPSLTRVHKQLPPCRAVGLQYLFIVTRDLSQSSVRSCTSAGCEFRLPFSSLLSRALASNSQPLAVLYSLIPVRVNGTRTVTSLRALQPNARDPPVRTDRLCDAVNGLRTVNAPFGHCSARLRARQAQQSARTRTSSIRNLKNTEQEDRHQKQRKARNRKRATQTLG